MPVIKCLHHFIIISHFPTLPFHQVIVNDDDNVDVDDDDVNDDDDEVNESVDNDFITCVLNLFNDVSEFLLIGWIKLYWQWLKRFDHQVKIDFTQNHNFTILPNII